MNGSGFTLFVGLPFAFIALCFLAMFMWRENAKDKLRATTSPQKQEYLQAEIDRALGLMMMYGLGMAGIIILVLFAVLTAPQG